MEIRRKILSYSTYLRKLNKRKRFKSKFRRKKTLVQDQIQQLDNKHNELEEISNTNTKCFKVNVDDQKQIR